MPRLALENVSKVFPSGTTAVDRLSIEVYDGELLVIVGPSGCGKTTTLRLIAGLDFASQGVIRIGDRVVNDVASSLRSVAMASQGAALYPHLTVARNLTFGWELRNGGWFGRAVRRLAGRQDDKLLSERVRDAVRLLRIEHLLERRAWELSGGERQRVSLAKAVALRAEVWLLDEPLASLDWEARLELRRELKRLQQETKVTTVLVTHDQSEALSLGDRIVVMRAGRLEQIGSARELFDSPASRFVAGFFGERPMNLVLGNVRQERGTFAFRPAFGDWKVNLPGEFPEASASGALELGIRPEGVLVSKPSDAPRDAIRGTVKNVEFAGAATFVEVMLESGSLSSGSTAVQVVGRDCQRTDWKPGEKVDVKFDLSRACFFDGVTGRNLSQMEKA